MNKKINIFCYKHPNIGIPNLMRYIAIGNVAMLVLQFINPAFLSYLTFSPAMIMRGQVWRIISFVFIPMSNSLLALISIYFYYIIGSALEARWGTGQFTIYYFTGILLTEIYGFILYFVFKSKYGVELDLPIDAQYVYLSMFFSFAALFPDMQVLLFFIIPIKIKWLALVDVALFIYSFVTTRFPFNLLPVVAVVNFLIFCGGDLVSRIKYKLNSRPAKSNVVDFQKESAKIRKAQENNLYTHKCCVCGRTDTDFPELEFRYCSQCAGYHCFCSDHINSHIHFTE